jgi:hypothetical protein
MTYEPGDLGVSMSAWSVRRVTAAAAISGGVVALVGNGLAPRFNDDDPVVYREIAHSTRYTAAGVIVLVAVLLVTAALVGIARSLRGTAANELAHYGRLAAVIGGALAVLQTGVELYGYKQQAQAFAGANPQNVVSAFWATNALDHLSSAMFAVWTLVFLGLAPVLIGAAQLRSRGPDTRIGYAAVLGGAVCTVVGVASLLHSDQSTFDVPFLIGSLLVTFWLIATGVVMWRGSAGDVIDVSESATADAQVRATAG